MNAVWWFSNFVDSNENWKWDFLPVLIFKFDWIDQETTYSHTYSSIPICKANHFTEYKSKLSECLVTMFAMLSLSLDWTHIFLATFHSYWYSWHSVVVVIFNMEIATPKLHLIDRQTKAHRKIYPSDVFRAVHGEKSRMIQQSEWVSERDSEMKWEIVVN